MPAAVSSMAYSGQTPWHGLGNNIDASTPLDEWRVQAGMNWNAESSPVYFETGDEELFYMEDKRVLYRSDTKVPLSVVGRDFKTVQPAEVLEFFRDLVDLGHFTMETAGCLFGGKRLWALARARHATGKLGKGEVIRPYLFMATGLDGTLATTASFTTIRVVCNNTLQMALKDGGTDRVRVTHRGTFNEELAKQQLGLVDDSFDAFMDQADTLASKKVTSKQTKDFFGELFVPGYAKMQEEEIQCLDARALNQVLEVHANYPGQDTISANGTAWGLVNGVTAYLDHVRNTRTTDARLNDIWFGKGKATKAKAVELALEI